jgi:hypothetical protein
MFWIRSHFLHWASRRTQGGLVLLKMHVYQNSSGGLKTKLLSSRNSCSKNSFKLKTQTILQLNPNMLRVFLNKMILRNLISDNEYYFIHIFISFAQLIVSGKSCEE